MAGARFTVSDANVDVSSRESVRALVDAATCLGGVTAVIHAAGVSASQASVEQIINADLYGSALCSRSSLR
jgi:NAD(P)-dependent dehydrogenase (short-subunit alcohol dehydrogenase family)